MLDEYQIDPAFNKNLVFSYQPPPNINATELPILDKTWLVDFKKIICEADNKLPKNVFDRHIGEISDYRAKVPLLKQLQLIYHRLLGHLDSELGKLSADNHQAIISSLTEDIIECSEGFHNRVNIIVDSFHKPRNLAELLCTVRKELVKEVATTLTNEVHAWNRISVIAASDGLGIKANFPDDTYSGALSETLIRRALQQIFYKKFTPFHLPSLLIAAFREFIPELEIEIEKGKKNGLGLGLQMKEKITRLIKVFLPEYINEENEKDKNPNNWENYFKISPIDSSLVDVNWEKMYRSFYEALSDNNYFKRPQINTLLDSAYYNLFLIKKTAHIPSKLISKLFKEEKHSDLLEQLVELNTRFPKYYQHVSKNKIFIKNCLVFIDYLTQQLKISSAYSTEIMQGLRLIIRLDLRRKNFIIEKIADMFLLKNRSGFNPLMLGAVNNPELLNDILVFLKKNEAIIDSRKVEEMLLMKNKDNCNALMLAASKQAEAIGTILSFLTTSIGRFANDTLHKLFTQQQKDSYTAVTLTARDHPDRLNNVFAFVTNYITFDGEALLKLFFTENANGNCTLLRLAIKNQLETTFYIIDFMFKNIKKFNQTILWKMFLEQDQDGFTILMLIARWQPKALEFIFTLIYEHPDFFPAENLLKLFLEKNNKNYNCFMLLAEFQPTFVPIFLNFIKKKLKIFKSNIEEILFTKNKNGYNSLILARHHPEALASIIKFIHGQPKAVVSVSLEQIFLEKHDSGLTFLMLLSRDKAESLKFAFEFIEKHPDLFTRENLAKLILETNELHYNSLMLAGRNLYNAVAYSLNFIQKHPEIFSPILLTQLLLAENQYRANALMIAAMYQPKAVKLWFAFLASTINHIDKDSINEFVFKKIRDYDACNAVFFGGRYNYRKSVMSVTAQLEDRTAINALLKFTDDHISLLGIQIFAELLIEKDNNDDYIFRPACAKYPFTMKKALNFIADSAKSEHLIPIQDITAYFIFEQFARWTNLQTDEDLAYKIIHAYSVPLLNYFTKDYFNQYPCNLRYVTDQLLDCYLKNPETTKNKYEAYTYRLYFFKSYFSYDKKTKAALALKELVSSNDFNLENLNKLEAQHPILTSKRLPDNSNLQDSILNNLFGAYLEIAKTHDLDICNSLAENNSVYPKLMKMG
ncbi:hypothetical protein [Rickettsiella endosymbiont of Miltochrista miniata]|uniref:hypothetical protein n=1 Tax=Rickettsiella endosymbiont of Miltochrista miniata TaxID=3066239 RepID=UPI00313C151C